jgi:hypothetical protein
LLLLLLQLQELLGSQGSWQQPHAVVLLLLYNCPAACFCKKPTWICTCRSLNEELLSICSAGNEQPHVLLHMQRLHLRDMLLLLLGMLHSCFSISMLHGATDATVAGCIVCVEHPCRRHMRNAQLLLLRQRVLLPVVIRIPTGLLLLLLGQHHQATAASTFHRRQQNMWRKLLLLLLCRGCMLLFLLLLLLLLLLLAR